MLISGNNAHVDADHLEFVGDVDVDRASDRRHALVTINAGGGAQATLSQDIDGNGYTVASANVRSAASFGVLADAVKVTGLTSNGTTTLTASSSIFAAGDVGKTVCLFKANNSGIVGTRTISVFVSATQVTLSGTIATASAVAGIIGTDDTVAWQDAINWACALTGGGVVTASGNKISLIAGAQVTGTVGSYNYSGQLLLPAVRYTAAMQMVEIRGEVPMSGVYRPGFSAPDDSGLVLFSTATSGWVVDVIPHASSVGDGLGAFSHIQFNLRRATIRTVFTSGGAGPGGVCLLVASGCRWQEWSVDTENAPGGVRPPSTGTSTVAGSGVVAPLDNNWGLVEFRHGQVVGYPKCISASEHALIDNVSFSDFGAGLCPGNLSALRPNGTHGMVLNKLLMQAGMTYFEPFGNRPISVYGNVEIEQPDGCLIDDLGGMVGHVVVMGSRNNGAAAVPSLSVKNAGLDMHFSSPEIPVTGTRDSALFDSGARATELSPEPLGLTDGSNHNLYSASFNADANGFFLNAGGTPYIAALGPIWRSRKISATIKTSATSSRTHIGLMARGLAAGVTNRIFLSLANAGGLGGVYLYKTTSFTLLASNTGVTVAANTSYAVDMLVQSSANPNGIVLISIYIDNVLVLSYTLTSAEAATYVVTGLDGVTGYYASDGDNGGSRATGLSITKAEDLPYVAAGVATLVGGTVDVTDTKITATSRIRINRAATGGTPGHLSYALSAATKFTINSSSGTDTSTVYYEVVSY